MSLYLEIPEYKTPVPFRTFLNDGMTIVYPHWHKEIEMIYSIRGSVNIGVNNQVIKVDEGEIFFFSSGEPHYFLASPDSERYVLQFDLKLFDEIRLRRDEKTLVQLFEQGDRHSRNWPPELVDEVRQLVIDAFTIEEEEPIGKNYLLLGKLYQMVGRLYQELPLAKEETTQLLEPSLVHSRETLDRLNKVFEYVESYYQEPINLEKAADLVGFSPYYFTKFFKTNTGKTFMNFLTEYRISQAKFILANEKLPMIEVAEKAGFASVKTFHHVFKEAVGVSPLKYQKNFKKIEQTPPLMTE